MLSRPKIISSSQAGKKVRPQAIDTLRTARETELLAAANGHWLTKLKNFSSKLSKISALKPKLTLQGSQATSLPKHIAENFACKLMEKHVAKSQIRSI